MTRTNRRTELARYRAHVRELLADRVANFDSIMHPDFGLNDQDAADIHAEIEQELRHPIPTLLMVTVSTRPIAGDAAEWAEEPGFCLGLRFCYADGVAHAEDLLIKQVRNRYTTCRGMKPREIRKTLVFTVWEAPNPPVRGGWPQWLGPTGYYR